MADQQQDTTAGGATQPTSADEGLLPMPEDTLMPAEAPQIVSEEPPAKPAVEPRAPATNVRQDYETFLPLDKPWDDGETTLPLAADTYERTSALLSAQPNIDLSQTEEGRAWVYYAQESRGSQQRADYFQQTVQRPDSEFRQAVDSEKGKLGAAAPVLKEQTDGVKLTGEAAVLRVRAIMGLGSIVSIPLWHSGFWLTFKAPGDSAMLELHRRLTEEKISLGRQTYGLAFSNNSVFFAGAVMDFALAHVYDASLKDKSIENIRARLSSLDLPLIAWGLACTMWPRGFQYARPVVDSEGNTKVIKERLALAKLLWVDTKQLTPWQIAHMAQRYGNTMTNDSVDKYRNEFVIGRGREVEFSEHLKMTLRVPSLDQYVNNGQRWVNGIVAMVDQAMAMAREGDVRDEYILNQGRATNFRQYGHWIESISAAGAVIDEGETMDKVIDSLSADDELRDKFFTAVRRYMEDSTMAIVAVPTFDPAEQAKSLPRQPHLLPLDVLSTFFTLLVQKADQVMNRD